MYPGMILGLSDHTPGHSCVLGAIALGARIIEKHFTDDCNRAGPDHQFSMDPLTWFDMVERTRELEYALGNGIKRVEDNERDTVVLQRRSLCATRDLASGHQLRDEDFIPLRPCPIGSISPSDARQIIGRTLRISKVKGDHLHYSDLESV